MLCLRPMSTRYFRAGIGTVIYNTSNEVAFFRRAMNPVGIWQFQQGGIDHNETPDTALWRELMEEVGLRKEDVTLTYTAPDWISYEDLLASTDATVVRLGQTHQWYFLKLNDDVFIDLTRATDKEFDEWKWVTFEEAIEATAPHKQHVYQELHAYFESEIQKTSR
jgi:putative (di)nucleoside polyphosphate hydrolase